MHSGTRTAVQAQPYLRVPATELWDGVSSLHGVVSWHVANLHTDAQPAIVERAVTDAVRNRKRQAVRMTA